MLPRILEAEVMETAADASDYDAMDHSAVNAQFAADFMSACPSVIGPVLDVGTGTAQIPIEICRQHAAITLVAVDLSEEMLRVGQGNVERAGLANRIRLERVNARGLHFPDRHFPVVISNSIIHHTPEPAQVLAEMVRVVLPGGLVFVRDLLRPTDEATLRQLVSTYTGDANAHQQQMFADSNFEYPVNPQAAVNPVIGRWGKFKQDDVNVAAGLSQVKGVKGHSKARNPSYAFNAYATAAA